MKRVTALLLSGLILLTCSCGAADTENGMQADNGETATQTEQAVTESSNQLTAPSAWHPSTGE